MYTLVLLLISTSTIAFAQRAEVAVQGKVLASASKAPVDFANILLLAPADSSLVSGAVSDATGSFHLNVPSGDYILQVKGLGYKPYAERITIPSGKSELTLPAISLSEESVQLQAVTVSAKRPIIARKADRLVFDAEQLSLGAQHALDVHRKAPLAPGVHVQQATLAAAS